MGLRTLILLLLIGLVIWLVRGMLRKPPDRPGSAPQQARRMLPCAHCGLHVPEDEAVIVDGKSYCCEEHRRQGADH